MSAEKPRVLCAQGHYPENSTALDLGPGTTGAPCLPFVWPLVTGGRTVLFQGVCEGSLSDGGPAHQGTTFCAWGRSRQSLCLSFWPARASEGGRKHS